MSKRWLLSIMGNVAGMVCGCYSGEQASLPDELAPPAEEEEETASARCDDNYELVDLDHYCPDNCSDRPFAVLLCGGQHCGHQQPLDLLASMLNCADSASDSDLRVGLFASAVRNEPGVLVREEPLGSIPARGQRFIRFLIPFEETISLLTEEPEWERYWSYRLLPEQDEGTCAWLYEPAAVLGDCLGR
jgi:hypothetical protein